MLGGDDVDEKLRHSILTECLKSLGSQWREATDSSTLDQSMRVGVMFVQSEVSGYHGPSASSLPPNHLKPGGTITCGGAINGTVGGFIKVTKQNGESDVYGLSCHHFAVDGAKAVNLADGEI